jgi:hypothetical protein
MRVPGEDLPAHDVGSDFRRVDHRSEN